MKSILILVSTVVLAQHHEMKATAEHPVSLYSGLGAWKHPIATKSPEAQKYFDQGLALLFGFNRYEALRSFKKASELDPSAPMPYWGMAASQGPYINMDGDPSFDLQGSCAAVIAGRKTTPNEREKAYLDAVASWCPEYRPADYVAALKTLAARWPDDLDGQTLYAESLMIPVRWKWYANGRPADGVAEAERTLEAILRRWPEHAGANHYYIHAVESSTTPERAIPSAQRLMGITPSMGHMVHMPGHVWLVLGDYEMAASVNERASAVDEQYMSRTNVKMGSYTSYYLHNLHFVVYARAMQGHRAEALAGAKAMGKAAAPMADVAPEMADAFLAQTVFARVRTLAWDEMLNMPGPGKKSPVAIAMWHYGRTLALLAKANRTAAIHERALFDQATATIPAAAPWSVNKTGDVMQLAREIVAARFGEAALTHWRKAVELQDAFVYDEPPAWYYPVRESLGAELVRMGQAAEGEAVLREGLKRSPRNGYMLFGLLEALKSQSKDTTEVQREFDAVWRKSDVKLTLDSL